MQVLIGKYSLMALVLIVGSATHLYAQEPYIPGVTDITTITTPSELDSAGMVKFLKKSCQDTTQFVQQVVDCEGFVEYRDDLKSYVISTGVPNTIDSVWVGIVCNWPQASRWLGKRVVFNGRYFQARGFDPKYGGETIYYLHLSAIR
ncbi:hypothetical protein [Fibrella aquatilis]|uniref:Uncharacterized protein n=1 Tax=Fibrella aquatilis TaxID=2817059 RepID=A0A939G3F8_9BACT|nr:hypothetical protein [Fibrella aquatilis]MBO0931354.1 hypothetical protein [Fibrella aquatilis]